MGENWEDWAASGLRIVLIVATAWTVRFLVRRAITRLTGRLSREDGERRRNAPLGGLLVNPERRRQRSETIGSVLRSTASVLVLGTAALMILDELGVQLGPLMASAGIAGVAIGFGARSLVADVLSGLFMLLEDQYGVGDTVDVGEATGTVMEIGLRVTTLRGDHGETWYVRNGEIKRVGNLSQGWATAVLEVPVAAEADLDHVRKLIARAGEELARTPPFDELLWEPVEVLGVDAVTAESVVLKATVKTQPGKAPQVERELRWRVKRMLDAAGVPQADPAAGPVASGGPPAPKPASGGPSPAATAAADTAPPQQPPPGPGPAAP
ncbi:mechanosensitive ion channel family protein [Streptomyces sp. DSM 44917]|uniref:Mechanosensitive ion channel family protein n=1 Tax=Streptomyces boetiae TaxID=3075541 RepID=A0ABU2L4X1_9ACTN|nr:mechanosensitive ion channel family protein [Streptomyces sp. DSM 44917]MDT0306427.1 mechanosensitive ion channel family protein [Streptomyces sp. DSM 44917]